MVTRVTRISSFWMARFSMLYSGSTLSSGSSPKALATPLLLWLRPLPDGKIGIANVAHLTLLHQPVHGAQGFLQGCERIVVVDLAQMNIIGLQPL